MIGMGRTWEWGAIFLFVGSFAAESNQDRRVGLYIIYTPSHELLLNEWFLPSIKDNYDIRVTKIEQECLSARFLEDGWKKTTLEKVDMLIQAIRENWGQWFVYADVDIRFYEETEPTLKELIEGRDLAIQKNSPMGDVCTGFFACRANERTLKAWERTRKRMVQHEEESDQAAFNYVLMNEEEPSEIKWVYLPRTFMTGALSPGIEAGEPECTLLIPEGLVLHHANWTIGIENKIKQLEYVAHSVFEGSNILTKPSVE